MIYPPDGADRSRPKPNTYLPTDRESNVWSQRHYWFGSGSISASGILVWDFNSVLSPEPDGRMLEDRTLEDTFGAIDGNKSNIPRIKIIETIEKFLIGNPWILNEPAQNLNIGSY